MKDKLSVEWWKLLLVFISALLLEANSVAGFRYLMDKNWFGMVLMVGVNPFLSLPMNHFSIQQKTFGQRALIAFTFSCGFIVGVLTIRPFFI